MRNCLMLKKLIVYINKKLIEESIACREQKNDFIKEFSSRYKTSPINRLNDFEPYTKDVFQKIYSHPIVDGVKLKFKYVILTVNGRYGNE